MLGFRTAKIVLLCSAAWSCSASAEGPTHVSAAAARRNLISKVEPVYPAKAKAEHVVGDVYIAIVISKNGAIESSKLITGDPLLTTSALDAVKQYKYKPFIIDGQPVRVKTEVLIRFWFPLPKVDWKREAEISS